MPQETLSTFLQTTLPPLEAFPPPEANNLNTNTTNAAYPPEHITGISRWDDFDIITILAKYGNVLREVRVPAKRVQTPQPVVSKTVIADRVTQYMFPRIITALDCAFRYEQANNPSTNRTPMTMDVGDMAHYADGFIPALAIYQDGWPDYHLETRPFNRVPGDVRPSWEWSWDMQNGNESQQREFRQALSQVRKYMTDNGRCRYGFILTDQELVATKRNDNSGHTYVSDPIPWSRQGNPKDPVVTPLLALWYLGMLAANDNGLAAWSF